MTWIRDCSYLILLMMLPGVIPSYVSSNQASLRQATATSSWAKLQISPNSVGSMPYSNFRVNIFNNTNTLQGNLKGNNKYYYAPICVLDNLSAVSYFNNVTQRPELNFKIWFWNDDIQSKVVSFIQTQLDSTAKASMVQVIPFEKLTLTTADASPIGYTLPTDWLTYQMHQSLTFKMICFKTVDCNNLAAQMKSNPNQFNDLNILFSLATDAAQSAQTAITVANIVSGKYASKLLQSMSGASSAMITAADENQLVAESAAKVIVQTISDSDVVSPQSQDQIQSILRDMLITSRTIIQNQSDALWNSVFWDNDNYRPDKTSSTLNDLYKTMNSTNQNSLSNAFTHTNKAAFAVNVGVKAVSVGLSSEFDTSKSGSMTQEQFNNLYTNSRDYVQWNGTKFIPKPLAVSRVNLAQLQNSQSFVQKNVKLSFKTAVLTIAVNIPNQNGAKLATDLATDVTALKAQTQGLQGII